MFTKGEWKATDYVYMNGEKRYDVETADEVIAMDVSEANAHLIAAAVNACIKLNPDNPMAVAESINKTGDYDCGCVSRIDKHGFHVIYWCPKHKAVDDLYEALKELVRARDTGRGRGPMDPRIEIGREAVAKAEGK